MEFNDIPFICAYYVYPKFLKLYFTEVYCCNCTCINPLETLMPLKFDKLIELLLWHIYFLVAMHT